MTSLWSNPVFVTREQYPEEIDALQSFVGLRKQENTYSASSHICLNCKVRSRTKWPNFQTHLWSHTKTNNPDISNHAPGKKAGHVQSVSLSIHVRCEIKKLHEVLMWVRNTGSLYMVKGSYSRARQAWVYALVLPLASRVASGTTVNLNFTKADNDMRVDKMVHI